IEYTYKNSLRNGKSVFFSDINDRSIISKNKSYTPDWIEEELKLNKIENNTKWNINDTFTLRTNLMYGKMKSRGDNLNIEIN
ncbi:TonB-dependent siderophore receptor, partial [Aliarcobacter lanthieri]